MTQKQAKYVLKQPDFGHFLAGLIDADGYFRTGELAITLDKYDLSMGLALKSLFGGRIRFYKKRRAFNYELNTPSGLWRVAELTKDKFRHAKRVSQFNGALRKRLNFPESVSDTSQLENNAWLAGFCFGDGSLQIKPSIRRTLPNAPERIQLMLQFSCEPACKPLLKQLQICFGGSVYARKNSASLNYSSGGFESARKIVAYFDRFGTCFRQRRLYLLFRQAYELVNLKQHLTFDGKQRLKTLRRRASVLRGRF